MGLFDNLFEPSTKDEIFYALASEEIASGQIRPGLWAKALADCEYNETKAKAIYLKMCVKTLKEELIPSKQAQEFVNLGWKCMNSNPPDFARAMHYNQLGYELNHAEGAANIGMLYENGWGVEKNVVTAATCYQKAIGMSTYRSAQADFQLAGLYEKGRGVNRDLSMAKIHYTEALRIATTHKIYGDLAQPAREALERLPAL